MNRPVTALLAFLGMALAALWSPGVLAEDASADARAAAIEILLKRSVEAWNAGDLEGFMDSYHRGPDLRFASGGTVHRGWQATLERYRQRYGNDPESMGRLSFEDIEMTHLAPDAVLVFGRFRLWRGNAESTGLFTLTVRRFDAGWRIVQDHTSAE